MINATHTHTAPVTGEKWYDVTEEGVLKPDAYVEFLLGRLAEAWRSRAPAGDQSPHPQMRRAADARMRRLRGNLSETRAIALRIADAFDEALAAVKGEFHTSLPFVHHVEELRLPARKISEAEYRSAKAVVDRLEPVPPEKHGPDDLARLRRHRTAVERFERPSEHATFTMELHVMRLGDVAVATNPFELFLDYGIQMKTRSRALHTFVVRLACSTGGYLPTEAAVAGGGYSAVPESGRVGPDGGRILVDRTGEILNGFWK